MNLDILNINPYLLFIIGAVMLFYGSEYLINNSTILAEKLNIPNILIGMTILAIGTSLPELVVNINASFAGNSDLVLGNIIGSNISNIALVFGSAILFLNFNIQYSFKIVVNFIFLIFVTIYFSFFASISNLVLSIGITLLLLFLLYLYIILRYNKSSNKVEKQNQTLEIRYQFIFIYITCGVILLSFGSDFFINGALGIAQRWGLDNAVVGLTLVALGTSIPELFVSINALLKQKYDFVIGNIIGSNIINIVFVGGVSIIINEINTTIKSIDYIFLLVLTLSLPLVFIKDKIVIKLLGFVFISIYFVFFYINFL